MINLAYICENDKARERILDTNEILQGISRDTTTIYDRTVSLLCRANCKLYNESFPHYVTL